MNATITEQSNVTINNKRKYNNLPVTTAPPRSCSPPQISTPNSTILSNAMPCMRNLFESGKINGRRQILSFVMHQSTGKMGDTNKKHQL